MSRQTMVDPRAMTAIARHWGWLLALGVVDVVVGVLALIWPGRTIVVLAVLFGLQLVVTGIVRFVSALAVDEADGGSRVLHAVLGILSLVVGLYALRHILVTVASLALLLGIFWIVTGVAELFTALSGRSSNGQGWTIVLGLLGIVVGVITLFSPAISLLALAVVVGVWLVVLGAGQIVLALRARSVGVATTAPAPAM